MMMLPAQMDAPIYWASLWKLLYGGGTCSSVSHFIQLDFNLPKKKQTKRKLDFVLFITFKRDNLCFFYSKYLPEDRKFH